MYIYERSDFSTKLYGAIIYPEHIKEGLGHRTLRPFVTGRFTMMTKFNTTHDEYLEINLETKSGVKVTEALKGEVGRRINDSLLKRNAEHRNNHRSMPHKVTPVIIFWHYEHPTYFKPGIKQKWVIKNK